MPAPTSIHATPARALDAARSAYWEDPLDSLAVAIDVHAGARAQADRPLQARALALQGLISLHRGDLRGAFALAADAEREAGNDDRAGAELAALMTHLDFFSGSYAAALGHAEHAMQPIRRAKTRSVASPVRSASAIARSAWPRAAA